ncbi:MAG TPA: ATP-binding protein [Bryobacterales bacterium]|nr:ATP-binding protein [Bryobacterales bacterium]
MSFKRRLTLSIVGLVLVLTAVLSVVYLRHLLRMQLQFAFEQARMVAQQVESATLDTISEPPPSSTIEESMAFWRQAVSEDDQLRDVILRSIGSFNTIAEIAVTDENGVILSGSADSMAGHHWIGRPEFQELSQKGFLEQLRSVYAPRRDYEISQTFGYEGRPVLRLHVAVSTAFLWGELKPQIRVLGLWALLSLLAALALAIVFSRIAFRPLDRLGEAIDRMTRGEYAVSLPSDAPKRDEYAAITSKLSLLGQQFRSAREGMSSLRGNMEQLMRKLEGAVLLFDPNDKLIIASAAADHFLGQGRWQMMGQSLEEVFAAGTKLGALVTSAVRLRQPIENQVVDIEPGEEGAGRTTRVLLSVEVMEDFASRRRLGTLVLLRDAETRRQIETQVEVSNRLAAITRLTGGVAHEIKNPLNAITLHLELLKNRLSGLLAAQPPELDVIVREIARLDRVVKTFLDFNRPVELRLAEVRLDRLIEEIAALARPEAVQRGVRIQVMSGCPDGVVKADRDLLKQAVLNLAVNGIQAMPSGGELKLALERAGPEVELSVSDQGVGIAAENREKIFRLYYTTKKNGSGVGLAMTFRVVQLHNGTIDFSSEVGRGTTFRVRLPVVEAR